MAWHRLDWLLHEASFLGDELDNIIGRIYVTAFEQLKEASRARVEEVSKQRHTNGTYEDTAQYIDYLEFEWLQQQEALAAMCLALLETSAIAFLNRSKRYLDGVFQPAKKYAGKSELLRRVTEYKKRLGIDLEHLPGFETLREVVLARNCCIHKEGTPDKDYQTQTKARFIDEAGKINLEPSQFTMIVSDLKSFAEAVADQLCGVRDQRKPLANGV